MIRQSCGVRFRYDSRGPDAAAEDGTAELSNLQFRVDATAEDATAELLNLGWTLRRSQWLRRIWWLREPPDTHITMDATAGWGWG